ncbi:MAG: adenylate/guanylate cyclase domain-containing protein [Nitrospinae bacterium]|nr:adenylate/guanylate cyclase domain-containing protein [Nitrospinota bacterium]
MADSYGERMNERVKVAAVVLFSIISAVALVQSNFARTTDLAFYDLLLNKVPGKNTPVNDIAIIGIDDESLKKADTPLILWVGFFAKAVDALREAGAKAVVFDIIPAISLDRFAPQLDQAFLKAMRDAKDAGMPVYLGFKTGEIGGQLPHPKFAFMASGLGFTNLYPDADGKMRRQNTWFEGQDGQVIPSLSMVAATAYRGIPLEQEAICRQLGICGEGMKPAPVLIDYRISQEKIAVHSIYNVLIKAQNGDSLKEDFGGKLVFIGPMSEKLPDNHRVPLNPREPGNQYTPGLVIQAQTTATLLAGQKLTPLPNRQKVAITLVLAVVSLLLMFKVSPLRSSLLVMILAGVVGAGVMAAFAGYAVLPLSPVIYGLILPAGIARSYLYVAEYKQMSVLKKYFGSYVSREVMKDILKNPEKVNFDGSLVEITIMFTDIRNFTTLSEKLQPPEVTRGLNTYLSAMTTCIVASGGYVNRYLGDGILALYGAPSPLPNNGAREAVRGGLDMLKRLEELNKEELFPGVKELKIGIGIHTGKAIVGNVGCFEKMDYTVVGDSANLASRIEGLTKQYGVAMLVSESTYALVKDVVEADYVDSVTVKGREHPTPVYHITSLKEETK